MQVGCVKDTCGTHVKYSILYGSTGENDPTDTQVSPRRSGRLARQSGIKAFQVTGRGPGLEDKGGMLEYAGGSVVCTGACA